MSKKFKPKIDTIRKLGGGWWCCASGLEAPDDPHALIIENVPLVGETVICGLGQKHVVTSYTLWINALRKDGNKTYQPVEHFSAPLSKEEEDVLRIKKVIQDGRAHKLSDDMIAYNIIRTMKEGT